MVNFMLYVFDYNKEKNLKIMKIISKVLNTASGTFQGHSKRQVPCYYL